MVAPVPANPPAGAVYCTVCAVAYAKGQPLPQGSSVPLVAIVWLPNTVWYAGLLPVCYTHGVEGYQ